MRDLVLVKDLEQYKRLKERFIHWNELNQILQIIKSNDFYRILIMGPAGCGKTTLLHMLLQIVPSDMISAIKIQNKDSLNINYQSDIPLLVDDIDTLPNLNHFLLQLNAKNNKHLVVTSINNITNCDIFTHIVEFKPLTQEQILFLLKEANVKNSIFSLLFNSLNASNLTPRIISEFLMNLKDSELSKFYSKFNNLFYQYGNGLCLSSEIIIPNKELIVPPKEITTDITFVNDTLLKQAQQNPKIMHSFSPREFEQMVCELLEKQGYSVNLTKQTRDGGKDIIIIKKLPVGELCIFVECKKYSAQRPVSVKIVRELYGTVEAEKATAGMLITTSYFTKDAKEFTEKARYRMALRDYNDLVQELNKINFE